MNITNIRDAIKRAKALQKSTNDERWPKTNGTTVFKLVEKILNERE